MLPKQVLSVVKSRAGTAVQPVSENNDDQCQMLTEIASEKIENGATFGVIGQSFNTSAAIQFQDSRRIGDVDVYHEVDEFGNLTGKSTIMLEHDLEKPHKGPKASLLQLLRAVVGPFLGSVCDELLDVGGFPLKLFNADGISVGRMTPDLAVYKTPVTANDAPTLLAQVSYRHETLEELFNENKLALDCSSITSAWAIDVSTCKEENSNRWKLPKMSIFVLQKIGSRLCLSGPKSFGAETGCNRQGIPEFQVHIKGGHLLREGSYPEAQNARLRIDLFHLQALSHKLLLVDGGLGYQQLDSGFQKRHTEDLKRLAAENDILLESELTRAQKEEQMVWISAD